MSSDPVVFSRTGDIARLTFNRPDKLNALSPDLIEKALAFSEAAVRSDARVLIVSGAGRAFSAGVDLAAVSSSDYGADIARRFSENARQLALCWETAPQAVIAKVSGYCFTGGLELALACDFILASDDAVFCDTHARLGFRPAWGLSARLPRRIGIQRARELSFTARRVDAKEAVTLGLIVDAVPADELEKRVTALADQIVANSRGAIAAYKDLYRMTQNLPLDHSLQFEARSNYPIADRQERRSSAVARLARE
jgi:enoyl-CoA hydratase/carnithine racemase